MKSKVNLETKIKNLTFRNPVTVASGTFGTKGEYAPYVNLERLGAIITKTITLKGRAGNPMPRIIETTGGMLNAIGLQNKGLQDFVEHKIPFYRKLNTPLIVNIAAESIDEFGELTRTLTRHKPVVKAIELNLSCPNVEAGGVSFMRKRERILDVIRTVRDETDLPLIAKLSPELGDVLEIAADVLKEGADALSLINTLKGMAVNIATRQPHLSNVTGGLSGPAIKPVALRYVYEARKHFKVPIVASGGIMTAQDALEFIIAGADMIAVGTANFVNPRATTQILEGIEEYCRSNGIRHINELKGSLHNGKEGPVFGG